MPQEAGTSRTVTAEFSGGAKRKLVQYVAARSYGFPYQTAACCSLSEIKKKMLTGWGLPCHHFPRCLNLKLSFPKTVVGVSIMSQSWLKRWKKILVLLLNDHLCQGGCVLPLRLLRRTKILVCQLCFIVSFVSLSVRMLQVAFYMQLSPFFPRNYIPMIGRIDLKMGKIGEGSRLL